MPGTWRSQGLSTCHARSWFPRAEISGLAYGANGQDLNVRQARSDRASTTARLSFGALLAFVLVEGGVALWFAPGEVEDGAGYVTTNLNVAYAIAAALILLALLRFAPIPARLTMSLRWLGLATLGVHSLGLLAGLYARFPWFDNALHFSFGVGACILGVRVVQSMHAPMRGQAGRPRVVLLALVLAVTLASTWEVFEYTVGIIQGTRLQAGVADTMRDMLATVTGGMVAAAWLARHPASGYGRRSPSANA